MQWSLPGRFQLMVRRIALAVLLAACMYGFWRLCTLALLPINFPVHGDANLYYLVGKGIVNGLIPYTDIFESKPPGIFLLYAASFLLFGSPTAVGVGAALCMIGIPVILALSWRMEGWESVLIAFLFGTVLSLYLSEKVVNVQPEAFGAFFGCVYVAMLKKYRWSWIPLMLGVGMKEPFILSLSAGAVLLAARPVDLVRTLLIPLAFAVATGAVVLLVLGFFPAYVGTYLPSMAYRIASPEPLWLRSLNVEREYTQFTGYSAYPTLGYALLLLWLAPAAASWRDLRRAAAGIGVLLLLRFLYIMILLAISLGSAMQWLDPFIVKMTLAYGAAVAVAGWCVWMNRTDWWNMLRFLIALLLALMAVASGGNYAEPHYAFAVPFYAALFLAAPRFSRRIAAVLCIIAVFFFVRVPKWEAKVAGLARPTDAEVQASLQLDSLMDACGIERYAVPLDEYLMEAKHSPVGPLVNAANANYLPDDHPLKDETRANWAAAELVLTKGEGTGGEVPECALPYIPIPGRRIDFMPPN